MTMLKLFLFALLYCVTFQTTWVAIFTSSHDILDGGYRHQADAYRFTQLLLDSGVPREHIWHMNPDTAANDPQNPIQTHLFTEPNCDAWDVIYNDDDDIDDCVGVDYTNTTVSNFKKMIGLRNMTTNFPLDIDLRENDTIIIYIVGHGDTGTIACNGEYIFYDDIVAGLDKLLFSHHYLHIYLFVDTCKAGSLFNHTSFSQYVDLHAHNLTVMHDINVLTAANATQMSFAINCNQQVLKKYPTTFCLTDEFSKHLMDFIQDATTSNTMLDLIEATQLNTFQSSVTLYGRWQENALNRTVKDVFETDDYLRSIDSEDPIYESCNAQNRRLRGNKRQPTTQETEQRRKRNQRIREYIKKHPNDVKKLTMDEYERLNNLEFLSKIFNDTEGIAYSRMYNEEKERIRKIKAWEKIVKKKYPMSYDENTPIEEWGCFRRMVTAFDKKFGHSRFGMSRFHYFASLCNTNKTIYKSFWKTIGKP